VERSLFESCDPNIALSVVYERSSVEQKEQFPQSVAWRARTHRSIYTTKQAYPRQLMRDEPPGRGACALDESCSGLGVDAVIRREKPSVFVGMQKLHGRVMAAVRHFIGLRVFYCVRWAACD
jgi:hypothetical protein